MDSVPTNPATSLLLPSVTPRDLATEAIRQFGNTPPKDSAELLPDEDYMHVMITDNLKRLNLDPTEYRFFGKSSGAMLIQTAIELKNEFTGGNEQMQRLGSRRPDFWTLREVGNYGIFARLSFLTMNSGNKKTQICLLHHMISRRST